LSLEDHTCGWIAQLPAPPPPRLLAGRERADCVVVGAGFTGLAAARQLAVHRPDWRIVVVGVAAHVRYAADRMRTMLGRFVLATIVSDLGVHGMG
jgi:NADH dehydrogenase FAD-containing subunit